MHQKLVVAALAIACVQSGLATAGDAAQADAARKKSLQRCDQLGDKAEVECLKKARERIVEARKQREGSGNRDGREVPKSQ
jgi:hypothetical protein